jgi:hypothetical protein
MADKPAIFDSPITRFRLAEAGKPDATGLVIDVHVIAPGHGSSGYYSEQVLKKACVSGVYPKGMHMHWDHPTATAESEQPARSLKDLVGVFTEAGRYDVNGWDGPGVYARAKIFPEWVDSIKAMDGHIGISHYVSGVSEDGADPSGKKCRVIKELLPDQLNTVDFVTVPGAGGRYRTLFSEMKVGRANPNPTENPKKEKHMGDNQESLTLSEIRSKHPEVVSELRKQLSEELKTDMITRDQTKKLEEAAGKIKALETEIGTLRSKVAETAAREIIAKALTEAKMPEASGKVLMESLMKQVPLKEDTSEIDTVSFGARVAEAIKGKTEELAAVLKEAGNRVHDNGTPLGPESHADVKKARESYRDTLLKTGACQTKEEANAMAGIEVSS